MKTALLVCLFAAFSWAQAEKPAAPPQPTSPSPATPPSAAPSPTTPPTGKPEQARRLVSLTWDLVNRKLVWVVENGALVDDQFVASSADHYAVSPDGAFMSVKDQKRTFGDAEAASLRRLLDVLSLYCAESVIWWEQGQPDVTDAPKPPDTKSKVSQPQQKSARANRQERKANPARSQSGSLVADNAAH
jgi:hypothetical protein